MIFLTIALACGWTDMESGAVAAVCMMALIEIIIESMLLVHFVDLMPTRKKGK